MMVHLILCYYWGQKWGRRCGLFRGGVCGWGGVNIWEIMWQWLPITSDLEVIKACICRWMERSSKPQSCVVGLTQCDSVWLLPTLTRQKTHCTVTEHSHSQSMQPKCGKFIKKLHFYRNPKLCVGENDYLYSQCFNIIFFPVSAEAPHSVTVVGWPTIWCWSGHSDIINYSYWVGYNARDRRIDTGKTLTLYKQSFSTLSLQLLS